MIENRVLNTHQKKKSKDIFLLVSNTFHIMTILSQKKKEKGENKKSQTESNFITICRQHVLGVVSLQNV